jgi:twitching motility protein PilT
VISIDDLLVLCAEHGASDLHLTTDEPPILRIHGQLLRTDAEPLQREELTNALYGLLTR